jgi:predicted metal-dependent hydrolase
LVFVRHPRARRYVIRVRPDRSVRVTIPRRGSKREAIEFAQRERAWIATQLERLAARAPAVPARAEPPPEQMPTLRRQAAQMLPSRLLALADRYGLRPRVARITIRNQRWRWGSCSSRGCISLNWRLLLVPEWVSDYVMIHELMHLKRMDHSKTFWRLVADACPTYRDARRWLREHQHLDADV